MSHATALQPTEIVDAGAKVGYSFEIVARAVEICEEDHRDGSSFWDRRGPLALLRAVETVAEQREQRDIESADAHAYDVSRALVGAC